MTLQPRKQRTIKAPCSISGRGYWTGRANTLSFLPAAEDSDIRFVLDHVETPATAEYSSGLSLRTRLGNAPAQLDMVEHIMAALYGLQIDNCRIECTSNEMPGLDGSSLAVALALSSAGIQEQDAPRALLEIRDEIRVGDESAWVLAQPVSHGGYEAVYQLEYPLGSPIRSASFSCLVTPESFSRDLAPARTFVTQQEAEALQSAGLASHVTYQDLVVFGDDGPIDNSLRFEDECARHKTLDLIGDLALSGVDLVGRFTAHKSGHQLNAQMAAKLRRIALDQLPLGVVDAKRAA